MVRIDLEKPDDIPDWKCALCGQPMRVTHHWIAMLNTWMHASVHERCIDGWDKNKPAKRKRVLEVPERFAQFDATQADPEALRLCETFSPLSRVKTLAITGTPHQGKSRLLWATVVSFFDELGQGSVDAYLFETLMTEFDRGTAAKIASARYVLVDDVGAVQSYGRERAALQSALRSRIKNNQWTFLSIDNMDFDPELENVFKGRALVVTV